MPDNKHSDEEIKVRSVMMRLYHSQQVGEAFYHANLVNGEAPKLEAIGWIERRGEGWRLTELGMQAWAEMNVNSFNSKYHYQGPFYKALRDRLVQGEDQVDKTCKKEGCGQPRMVSKSGVAQSYCETHQREYWSETKRKGYTKSEKPVGRPATDPISSAFDQVSDAAKQVEQAARAAFPEAHAQIETILNGHMPQHDCDHCQAKDVIEALRAKSPKLAKLIDAMQAEVEAERELGL